VNWVLDADIRGFFDNLSHAWAMKFIEHRVADRRILRLIRKWLKAGVSEDGQWSETKLGTPQGAVASPLIANVYLHYVFDLWADIWRRKVAKGDVVVVRYADDLVVGFQHRTDAERFLKEFRERLAKFGLELHPDKTRLIEFGRFAARDRKQRGEGKPETFTFLGFTHYCGQRQQERNLHRMADYCEKANGREAQKPSRLSFNAGCMIAWPKSVRGSGRSCWVITNITLFPGTRRSCASSNFACAGYGRAF
jgi:group II intron reverse transcriptase/maturase